MISALGFVLECAAVAAVVGTIASLVVLAGQLLLARMPSSPARRADAIFALTVVPAAATLAVVLAAAAPSLLAVLGLGADHCTEHRHHLHLCILHSAGVRPALAAAGTLALAVFVFRAGLMVSRQRQAALQVRALERLGERKAGAFPRVLVPGAPRLCHAVGILDRRVILSGAFGERLGSPALGAALAHEYAHLRRRDPLALALLELGSLFLLPGVGRRARALFQVAAEEACDAEAALELNDPLLVAEALVEVARLQRALPLTVGVMAAFGEQALERRVRALTGDSAISVAAARGLSFSAAVIAAGMTAAVLGVDAVHHAVETLLHLVT